VGEIFGLYEKDLLGEYEIYSFEVEEMACGLMSYDSSPSRIWCHLPVFVARTHSRLTLAEISGFVNEKGLLYIESKDNNTGADYSAFNAPVLAGTQPGGALELLKNLFGKRIIDLGPEDVVLEAPEGSAPPLGPAEKRFNKHLGFHPHALEMYRKGGTRRKNPRGQNLIQLIKDLPGIRTLCEESLHAREDLAALKWRGNYLVGRDGRTPCLSHRFLFRNSTVVLNLYHPDVEELVRLSQRSPDLASHWALAMCISEENRILPHLSPQAREELIMLDAMAKCGFTGAVEEHDGENIPRAKDRAWREFKRNLEDHGLGLG
jgi:hypothetical protein